MFNPTAHCDNINCSTHPFQVQTALFRLHSWLQICSKQQTLQEHIQSELCPCICINPRQAGSTQQMLLHCYSIHDPPAIIISTVCWLEICLLTRFCLLCFCLVSRITPVWTKRFCQDPKKDMDLSDLVWYRL